MEFTEQEKQAWRMYYAAIINGFFSSCNSLPTRSTAEVAANIADTLMIEDKKRFNKTVNN
jgi:hypothetical protein